MTVFDYIIENNLPLSMCKTNDFLIVNCHAWDIQEVDDLLKSFKGTRIGFDIKISMEDICQKQSQ